MGRTSKMKVSATQSALNLLSQLQERYGEKLMFHQSGGCCDGSAPMCFPRGDFKVGSRDIFLGEIGEQPFFIAADQFEYWEHTQLIIDVVKGRGGMFSVEGPTGKRFLTRSKVYSDDEWKVVSANPPKIANSIDFIDGLLTTS